MADQDRVKVNILGSVWTIISATEEQEPRLYDKRAFADFTKREIIIEPVETDKDSCADQNVYTRKVLRHEIVHAFMSESGLMECWEHTASGQDETVVDWFATQYPKIKKVYAELGIEG